jgi:hypothetical protein
MQEAGALKPHVAAVYPLSKLGAWLQTIVWHAMYIYSGIDMIL